MVNMSDTVTLRDHSHPCEHPAENMDGFATGAVHDDGYWQCVRDDCPGGREVTLRKVRVDNSYRTEDVPDHIEAVVNVGQWFDGFVYLEVPDERGLN